MSLRDLYFSWQKEAAELDFIVMDCDCFYDALTQSTAIFVAVVSVFSVYRLQIQDTNIKLTKNGKDRDKRIKFRQELKQEAFFYIFALSTFLAIIICVGSIQKLRDHTTVKITIGIFGVMLLSCRTSASLGHFDLKLSL